MTKRSGATSLLTIHALLHEQYGVTGRLERLSSERDELFRVICQQEPRFILRITNAAEDPSVTDFQTEVHRWLAVRDPDLPVQRLIRTLNGELSIVSNEVSDGPRTVRLMSYLPGQALLESPRTLRQCGEIGGLLARLSIALREFHHPAQDHQLAWDLKHFARLGSLMPNNASAEWTVVRAVLQDFDTYIAPRLPTLPSQVVHNDFNLHNILVDAAAPESITGILDFGDMVHTPRICDLAIAASYHLDGEPMLERSAALIGAYHRASALDSREIELLYDLLRVRLAATVIITEWRAERHPENRKYIQKNTRRAWEGLTRLRTLSRDQATRVFRAACQ